VPLVWSDAIDDVDWSELSALYRVAPLGNKHPSDLKTAFSNSRFRSFVYDEGKLVAWAERSQTAWIARTSVTSRSCRITRAAAW